MANLDACRRRQESLLGDLPQKNACYSLLPFPLSPHCGRFVDHRCGASVAHLPATGALVRLFSVQALDYTSAVFATTSDAPAAVTVAPGEMVSFALGAPAIPCEATGLAVIARADSAVEASNPVCTAGKYHGRADSWSATVDHDTIDDGPKPLLQPNREKKAWAQYG